VDQFAALEKKFGLKTLHSFPEWGEFVEVTQRRNLVTHNGGIVTEQYLRVCTAEGCTFYKPPNIGDKLDLDPKYVLRSLFLAQKVGFMLAHTLWKKVFPEFDEQSGNAFNNAMYELLRNQHWRLAAELGQFGLSDNMKRNLSEVVLRIRVVNTAIGHKFSKNHHGCKSLLDTYDWSASIRDFQLAIAVLKGDFNAAIRIMKSIGQNGEYVKELSYHQWPLFRELRDSPEFQVAYKEIYGTDFLVALEKTEVASAFESKIEEPTGE
jgi:hypothetical protein